MHAAQKEDNSLALLVVFLTVVVLGIAALSSCATPHPDELANGTEPAPPPWGYEDMCEDESRAELDFCGET